MAHGAIRILLFKIILVLGDLNMHSLLPTILNSNLLFFKWIL